MKRVLVTGFEPFDGDSVNPSQVLLEYLEKHSFDFKLQTQVLPVSFTKTMPLLEKTITDFNPSHVVLTGYAYKRSELTIERIGINWVDARIPDNDGLTLTSQKILPDGVDGLFSTLPLENMIEASLAAGCPTKISTSAGEYVCNHVLYSFLSRYRNIPGTFIHIPQAEDHGPFFKGIKAILAAL